MAADARILDEDPDTGAKKFRYVRTGEDHFSLAFTYAWIAATTGISHRGLMRFVRERYRERHGQASPQSGMGSAGGGD